MSLFLCSGHAKKKRGGTKAGWGGGGCACSGGYKGLQAVRSRSVAGEGRFRVLL